MSATIPNIINLFCNLLVLLCFLSCGSGKIILSNKQEERGNFDVGPELPKECTKIFLEVHQALQDADNNKSQYIQYSKEQKWNNLSKSEQDVAIAQMAIIFSSCLKAEENYYFSSYTCSHEDENIDDGPKDYSVDDFKPLCNLIFQEAAKHGFDKS